MAQSSDRVAFLGPEGTFTEEALLANMPEGGLHPFPYPSIRDVLSAVQAARSRSGIVAIENALEGSVPGHAGQARLGLRRPAHRARGHAPRAPDAHHARRRCRWTRSPRSSASRIAYGQCRDFIREHLGNVEHEATDSTAEAVRRVSRVDRPWAAVGTRLAAEMYECHIAAEDIEDVEDNRTRFVFVAREPAPQDLEGRYKTSIVCGIGPGRAGQPAAHPQRVRLPARQPRPRSSRGRPSRRSGTTSSSSTSKEASRTQPVAQALKCLACKLPWVKVLGSYPA